MKKILLLYLVCYTSNLFSQEIEGISPAHSVFIMPPGMEINAYVKEYVEEKITTWQQKGEFEKTIDYQARVNEQTRKVKTDEYATEAIKVLKKLYAETIKWDQLELKKYDADNETYLLYHPELGNIVIPVSIEQAPAFKQGFSDLQFSNYEFAITDNQIHLSKLTLTEPTGNLSFHYSNTQTATYVAQKIDYNFPEVEIEYDQYKDNTSIKEQLLELGRDPVDTDIPAGKTKKNNAFALIIGNENYLNECNVPYAINDAKIFQKYTTKTLGLPEDNVHLLTNASLGQVLGELKWLEDISKTYNGEASILFYYAGHGMPDETTKDAFLLPVDGSSEITQTAIKLENLYSQLNKYSSKQVTVFMDACFSGGTREGLLADGRGVRIEPKENELNGNMVVITAASRSQTAYPYHDKRHGLFTYYLLEKLQSSEGKIQLGELSDYLEEAVQQTSVVKNNKPQNPKVNVSHSIQGLWRGLSIVH